MDETKIKHFKLLFSNEDKNLYAAMKADIANHNLLYIFDKYHADMDWDRLTRKLYLIPEDIVIKYIVYFIKDLGTCMNFGRSVVITEKIINTISMCHQNVKNDFWFSASINPTFLLLPNFENYLDNVSATRFAYNLNFPMDEEFIKRNIEKINIDALLNHQFLTEGIKNFIHRTYIYNS